MPVKLNPGHDELALKLQPYFIDKMLLDTHHDEHILRQLMGIIARTWQPLLAHKKKLRAMTSGQRDAINQTIVNQSRAMLLGTEDAIPETKIQTYRDITNELINAFQQELSQWEWPRNVKPYLVSELTKYANGANIEVMSMMALQSLPVYIDAWQLQVLDLYYVKNFMVRSFNLQMTPIQYRDVNLYEMGLTDLPDAIWMKYLVCHISWEQGRMNEYGHAYDKLMDAHHNNQLSSKDRKLIQNSYIRAETGWLPSDISADDRKNMYYHQLP